MKIEIICTGDEVLTGATINSNFSHSSQRLGEVGLEVRRGTTIGDDRTTLLEAFELASQSVELEFRQEWLDKMADSLCRRVRAKPESTCEQAVLPAGAKMLENPISTACGLALNINKARFCRP